MTEATHKAIISYYFGGSVYEDCNEENMEHYYCVILCVGYTEAGQFLSYSSGTLTKGSDGTYTASVAIQNNGDTDYLHIMMLSQDGWVHLAEAMEIR